MGLRIMWMSNAMWASTGYGTQAKYVIPRLQAMGHKLAQFAYYGLQGGIIHAGEVPVYPVGREPWGEDIIGTHMAHFKADVLISLLDVWATPKLGRISHELGWPWCPWCPIDYDPVPDRILGALQGCHTVLPYSRWGEDQLRRAGMQNVAYIPHGVDVSIFKPGDKKEARKALGLPEDRFIIGMVAANKDYPARKAFPEQLLAFARFKKKVPEALMYLHTWRNPDMRGIDIGALIKGCGLVEGQDVLISDPYHYLVGMPDTWVATLYQAMDLMTLTSMAEGFGLPIIEAQACGTPVLVANNTSQPELCFAGAVVEKQYPFWTPIGAWRYVPDVNAIADKYDELYDVLQSPEATEEMRHKARQGALAFNYDDVVDRYWRPFLERMERDIHADTERGGTGGHGFSANGDDAGQLHNLPEDDGQRRDGRRDRELVNT